MTTPPTLTSLPLFPLGSVLFPGGVLPLRIFEVRYLDLIGKCHKVGAPFGVVGLTQGAEVRVAGAAPEHFAAVGTLAMIREFHSLQPGLIDIECAGTQRFRVRSSALQKNGLWLADVEQLGDDASFDIPADLQHTADALRQLIDALEERRRAPGHEAAPLPIAAPWRLHDCGWVANRWCELLPLPAELKQRLMEQQSPLIRLELVSDLLAQAGITQ